MNQQQWNNKADVLKLVWVSPLMVISLGLELVDEKGGLQYVTAVAPGGGEKTVLIQGQIICRLPVSNVEKPLKLKDERLS